MAQATDLQNMTCPICRKGTTLPDGDLTTLPPNIFMNNLKDLITKETDGAIIVKDKVYVSADREALVCSLETCKGEAVMYCKVCQEYLCQTCADKFTLLFLLPENIKLYQQMKGISRIYHKPIHNIYVDYTQTKWDLV